MTTNLIPSPVMQFLTASGTPLVGGKLYTYAAGTTTPQATYTDSTGVTSNTNPVILNSRGEASIWCDSALTYYMELKDADDGLIWTANDVNNINLVTLSTFAASSGSSLIGYTVGTGGVTQTVQTKLREYISVSDFGATGDGSTDDTAAISDAAAYAANLGKTLFFPAGTYVCTTLTVYTSYKWVGESSVTSIIKLKNGTNAALITSASANDVWIESLRLDGNSVGNTDGNALVINGARPTLIDIVVLDAAGNGIVTNWSGPSFRDTGSEGHFSHITIDSSQKSGWLHSGPSDSHFDDIIIIDPGQKTDNAYYGIYLDPTGTGSNGRFNNLHHWTRSNATKIALAGVYVGFGGNTFTNCHFEGGYLPLNIAANFNSFSSCHYYAPRGSYAVSIGVTVSGNYLDGVVGDTYYTSNPNYSAINLAGAGNIINLVVGGAINAINFNDSSTGGNQIRIGGYLDSGGSAYTGTYAANDNIVIDILGAGGGTLAQGTPSAWTAYTPSVTAGVGALTSASATGRYIKIGKTIHFQQSITITDNGTGSVYIATTLPAQAGTGFETITAGRNNSTGKMLQCEITSGATLSRIFNYDNTYPAASGNLLYVSGTYEAL